MNKKLRIGYTLLVVVVAIAAAYFIGQNSRKSTPPVTTPSFSNVQTTTELPSTTKMVQPAQPVPKSLVTQSSDLQDKEQCASYRQQAQNELNQTDTSTQIGALYQVFYSSSQDSCLSAEYILYTPYASATADSEELVINDVLTGKTIWSQNYAPALQYENAYAKLDVQIAALK